MPLALARVGPVLGTSDFDGTSMSAEDGRDRMFFRGISHTDPNRQGVGQGRTRRIKERTPWNRVVSLGAVGDG